MRKSERSPSKIVKFTKTRTHQKYGPDKNWPGASTIAGLTPKPALVHAAWKLGSEGLDYREVWGKKTDVGSVAHFLIECHFNDWEPDLSEVAKDVADIAENCFLAYLEWEGANDVQCMVAERQMVSHVWKFGGTCDLDGTIRGNVAVVDFKSGKAIYDEHRRQIAALQRLKQEAGNLDELPEAWIVKLGQEDGSFTPEKMGDTSEYWEQFKGLLHAWHHGVR